MLNERNKSIVTLIIICTLIICSTASAYDAWLSEFKWLLEEPLTPEGRIYFEWKFNQSHNERYEYKVRLFLSQDQTLSSDDTMFYEHSFSTYGGFWLGKRVSKRPESIPLPRTGTYYIFIKLSPGSGAPSMDTDPFNNIVIYQNPIQVINESPRPLKATNPGPSIGAIDQPLTVNLNWSDGGDAISYDIYFGTNPVFDETEFKGNQTETSYASEALLYGTTYFWRIDAKNDQGTTTGETWSFTTMEADAYKVIYVDSDALGLNNGSSWNNAYNSLQDALAEAGSSDKPVEVHVAKGIYRPDVGGKYSTGDQEATFELINNVFLKGGYAGTDEVDPNERDVNAYETILSGDLEGEDIDSANLSDLTDEPTRAENSYNVISSRRNNMNAVLDGFTITAGNANGPYLDIGAVYDFSRRNGGGMYNAGGSPMLTNCIFSKNSTMYNGGGIYNADGSPMLRNCIFSKNSTMWSGGGIYNADGSTILTNCVFVSNSAKLDGGGMQNLNSNTALINCTFTDNSAHNGNAISCDFSQESLHAAELINCILWDGGNEIWSNNELNIAVTYSDIQGRWPGEGNISADPMFIDPANGNFRLSDDSPCIGVGIIVPSVPDVDIEGNPRPSPSGSNPDMGAYENSPQLQPLTASNPSPADGAVIEQKNPVLRWIPGKNAAEHLLYFGTDFVDVNDAEMSDSSGIYLGQLIDAFYPTEELITGTTYYWRIDEVYQADPNSPWKGNIWSFTVTDKITVEYQVSASEDDGYASNENLQNLSNDFLRVGLSSFAGPPYYLSGMVFRNLNIPQGSEIVRAHLKMRSYNNHLTDAVFAKIEAEATDDAADFTGVRKISSLLTTSAAVNWDLEEPWSEDTWYSSPDIAYVIQEVINREGWSAGNSLAILYSTRLREGGYRNISSFDRGSDFAPILEITYIPR